MIGGNRESNERTGQTELNLSTISHRRNHQRERPVHKNEQCQLMFVLGLVILRLRSIKRRIWCELGTLQMSKKHDPFFWKSSMVGKLIASQKNDNVLIPWRCYFTWQRELRLQMEFKLLLSWLWERERLPAIIQAGSVYFYESLKVEGEAEGSERCYVNGFHLPFVALKTEGGATSQRMLADSTSWTRQGTGFSPGASGKKQACRRLAFSLIRPVSGFWTMEL